MKGNQQSSASLLLRNGDLSVREGLLDRSLPIHALICRLLGQKLKRGPDRDIRRAMALGATACLTKPFDPLTLATELRAVLDPGTG